MLETITPRWSDLCIVAATGPSLTEDVAEACRGHPIVAVNDAWRRLPFADVLYACDAEWWAVHGGCPDFRGERWSSHDTRNNDKLEAARKYGLRIVKGRYGDTFSTDPSVIHYGGNSGFQGVNLAILFGARRIVLVGFDMRTPPTGQPRHFFGDHPAGLKNGVRYEHFIPAFKHAATQLPEGIEIVNATPGSALTCFPMAPLEEALAWA